MRTPTISATGLLICCSLAAMNFAPDAKAASITGLTEYSSDSTGAWFRVDVWNTKGPDGAANIYVSSTPSPSPHFLNAGNGAGVGVNIALPLGRTDLYLFAIAGTPEPYYGLNIFFDGNNANPGISVFAPVRTDSATPPPMAAHGVTPALDYSDTPASETLTYLSGGQSITVADYFWQVPTLLSVDFVGSESTSPNGELDSIGKISLLVRDTAIPEPSPLVALGSLVAMLGVTRRTRRTL